MRPPDLEALGVVRPPGGFAPPAFLSVALPTTAVYVKVPNETQSPQGVVAAFFHL